MLIDSVTEGLFLMNLGQSPYAGDAYHQAPLLIALFYPIQDFVFLTRLIYVLADLIIGIMLLDIVFLWQRRMKTIVAIDQKNQPQDRLYTHLTLDHLPELTAFL